MGDIKWADVIGALVDVGYDGTLNYETGKMAMEAYDEIQLNLVRLTYENGLYFVKQYEKALQVRR
jgi:sugar phosphate isomerase/epimerase